MTRILLVGGGGREHALAWKLQRDDPGGELIAAPGNPGIAALARCESVSLGDVDALVALAERVRPDFTVVGPEAPLAAGLVDRLAERGLAAFGPTRAAAEIETSKRYAKQLMMRAGVPTSAAEFHTELDAARAAVHRFGAPVVVKASGLAAGKGVIVCQTIAEAERAVEMMLRDGAFGAAGAEILVEQFMTGEELSLFALTDGTTSLPLLPAQDHKRLLDGDRGPNTGGMGAYAPVSLGTRELVDRVQAEVLLPTLAAMRDEGRPFRGLLYAGLMLTADGPKVVEFNCRFGDPETQAILPLMRSSLLEPMLEIARGGSIANADAPTWRRAHAVTTVVATAGYPERARTGDTLLLPADDEDAVAFHAGTRQETDGSLVSAGGRVVAMTAVAESLGAARARSRDLAESVQLDGKQLRRDIGWRELARTNAAAPPASTRVSTVSPDRAGAA